MRPSIIDAALVFVAVPTLAAAHAGNNGPDMVRACVGEISKVVRAVGVDGVSISVPLTLSETPAHWLRIPGTGPQGPKGDPGPQGLPGPQSTPGTNGTNGTDGASVTFVAYRQQEMRPARTAAWFTQLGTRPRCPSVRGL